jgi:nucleoside-diphosphate-sugar epimerase
VELWQRTLENLEEAARCGSGHDMKILITGNMGYVGPAVVKQLRRAYPLSTLIGFDEGYFGHCLTTRAPLPECQADVQYFGDVRKLPESLLEGVDAIVHLAALSNDPIGNRYEEITIDINFRASVELARRAKRAGVTSFAFASSCSVYGSAESGPRNENSAVNPLTAYARSKVMTESELEQFADSSFRITVLRFATACGMSDRLRLDLVLNDFVACAVSSGKISILSDGTPWRPLINVKDMARALEWAVGRANSNGNAYVLVNAGSNRWNYQVKQLAEAVARVIPGTDVSINRDAQPDKRSYRVDFSRFESLAPNHQPVCTLEDTITELKTGLEAMGFCDPAFRDGWMIRLKMLDKLRDDGLLNERLEWEGRAGRVSEAAPVTAG